MKKIITATIFTLFLAGGLKAQTFPTFSRKMLLMKVTTSTSLLVAPYVSISDGETNHLFELSLESYSFKKEAENPNARTLANLLNRLLEQGYKLIATSATTGGFITYHYFQKD